MRKWSIKELESIEADFMLIGALSIEDGIRGIAEDDAAWMAARINTREMHGNFYEARCDACGIEGARIMAFVDEYHDGMGTPLDLNVTYLCYMDR